jgi:multicomponent Na+:H+ antiporter subunit F
MSGVEVLSMATSAALVLLSLAMLLAVVRLARGPTLADRVLALDLMTTLAVGYIATFAVRTGFTLYLDIAIAIGLVGFLSTVAFARYLLTRGERRAAAESGDAR